MPSDVRAAAIWLYGGIQVNSATGMYSKVIREYNVRQGQLRLNTTFTEQQLQQASNAVGLNFANSIVNGTDDFGNPNLGQGKLPTVQEIGNDDLLGVRNVLYPGNETPGTELYLNQAWPGIVMLGALGGQYTDRLLRYDDKQPAVLDSLGDLKSLLFCWESFRYAFDKTLSTAGNAAEASDQLITMNLALPYAANAWDAYIRGGVTSFAQAIFAPMIEHQNAEAKAALTFISQVGSNRFMDMLMGSIVGKPVAGATTDANFRATANTVFGKLSADALQSLKAEILPTDVSQLATRAAADVNVRAALAGLSIVSIQVSNDVAASLSLYDPSTGTGPLSQDWIRDRAAMTSYVARSGWSSSVVFTGADAAVPTHYTDAASGAQVLLGAVLDSQRAQVYFGSEAGDTFSGYGKADHLYGGAGNDTLSGQGGNDWLEGNAGSDSLLGGAGRDTLLGGDDDDTLDGGADSDLLLGGKGDDTYQFTAGWGQDEIRDSDGKGRIAVDGIGTLSAAGSMKIGASTWQSADKRQTYTLVAAAGGAQDLYISFSDRPDSIIVRGWSPGSLGITLTAQAQDHVAVALPPSGTTPSVIQVEAAGATAYNQTSMLDGVLITSGAGRNLDVLAGGDNVVLAGGNDTITGGYSAPSNDVTAFASNSNGNNIVRGSGGQMVALLGGGNNFVSVDGQTDIDDALAQQKNAVPTGHHGSLLSTGNGNNTVIGGNSDDAILVGSGNNVVVAGAGHDLIVAGGAVATEVDGAWTASFAAGEYHLDGVKTSIATHTVPQDYEGNFDVATGRRFGDGDDTIYGGAGSHSIWLSNGSNDVNLGSGNSTVAGGNGDDTILCGSGDVLVDGAGGDNYIVGGAGHDTIFSGNGDNIVVLGAGDAVVNLSRSELLREEGAPGMPDWKDYRTGGNYVLAGSGHATIYGANGDDTLVAGSGDASIYGGHGNEHIEGGSGTDLLVSNSEAGSSRHTVITAGSGNTTIRGGEGDDTLYGGDGVDYIVGGNGNQLIYSGDGGTADDPTMVTVGSGNSTVFGGNGALEIIGGSGSNVLMAGDGDTTIIGGSGDEALYAGGGRDVLLAGSGADTLYGGSGSSVLHAGEGSSRLVAGSGHTTMVGSAGSAVFKVGSDAGDVVVTQAQAGNMLQFDAGIAVSDLHARMRPDGGIEIGLPGGGSVLIEAASASGIATAAFDDGASYSLAETIALSHGEITQYGIDGSIERTTLFTPTGSGTSQAHMYDGNGALLGSSEISNDGRGTSRSTNFDADGSKTQEEWHEANGSHGTTTYGLDGSTTATVYGADGACSVSKYDGRGNVTVVDFDATGRQVATKQTRPWGTVEETRFNADGSSTRTTQEADGSRTVMQFASGGNELSETTYNADGTGTAREFHLDGTVDQTDIGATGTRIQHFDALGDLASESWQNNDGSSGSVSYGADGASATIERSADGSVRRTELDSSGKSTATLFASDGTKLSDTWTKTDGSHGSDIFQPDGASSGEIHQADASHTSYVDDGSGNRSTTTYDANGVKTGDVLQRANGTSVTDSFHSDGSVESVGLRGDGTRVFSVTDASGHVTATVSEPVQADSAEPALAAMEDAFVASVPEYFKTTLPLWATPAANAWSLKEDKVTSDAAHIVLSGSAPGVETSSVEHSTTTTSLVTETEQAPRYEILSYAQFMATTGGTYSNADYTFVTSKTSDGKDVINQVWHLTGYDTSTTTKMVTQTSVTTEDVASLSGSFIKLDTGDANHVIETSDSSERTATRFAPVVVNAGAGDDFIAPGGLSPSDFAAPVLEYPDIDITWFNYTFNHGPKSFLYGGAGNDTLIGTTNCNDTLVGGAGEDLLNGRGGSDSYTVFAGSDQGHDVIDDTGYFDLDEWASKYADPAFEARLYLSYGDGVLSNDVVAFQPGISLANLKFGWSTPTAAGGQPALDISWGNGASISVVVPEEDNRHEGEGIETFTFADGTQLSMDEMLALAPPRPAPTPLLLSGTSGNDSLKGLGADDTLVGAGGADSLVGGSGDDLLYGDFAPTRVVVRARASLADGVGAKMELWLNGTKVGEAMIDNTSYADHQFLVNGPVSANAQLDVVFTNDAIANGQDRNLWVDTVTVGDHVMRSKDPGVVIDKGAGDAAFDGVNTIAGQSGVLWNGALRFTVPASAFGGDAGDDLLKGGTGNDTLDGGAGDDSLYGGAGTDTYVFGPGYGNDLIVDDGNGDGTDVITIAGGLNPEEVAVRRSGNDLVLAVEGGADTVTIASYFSRDAAYTPIGFVKFDDGTVWDAGALKTRTLIGTASDDRVMGYDSNDTLVGGGGADFLSGDSGNDLMLADDVSMPVVVRARASLAQGVGAQMQLWVNGKKVGQTQVQNTSYADYRFDLDFPLGAGAKVDVVFCNDAVINGQDRNLWVDTVTVGSHVMRSGDAGVVLDKGADAAAFDGKDTVAGQSGLLSNGALRFTVPASIFGLAGNDTLSGGDGNDTLMGGEGDDLYMGGSGNDLMIDTSFASADEYHWGRYEGGADIIDDAGGDDRLVIEGGATDELWFRRSSSDLDIAIIGTDHHAVIRDWYADPSHVIETIVSSDGKLLSASDVQNLVDAMAAFAPPAAGQTELPPGYRDSLSPVLAANWH